MAFTYDTDWDMERQIALDAKERRIRKRLCTFPDCERRAGKGWTTCDRHHTAGARVSHWLKLHGNKSCKSPA